ncbi:MAG: hypothetical protein V1743_00905 [Nanoarchaeota archaeon]
MTAFHEYHVRKNLPVRGDWYEIHNLWLENIYGEHVTIPSLDVTLNLHAFSDLQRWQELTVVIPISQLFLPDKYRIPLKPHLYGYEIAQVYLQKKFGNEFLEHWVNTSKFTPADRRKRNGTITIEGLVIYTEA